MWGRMAWIMHGPCMGDAWRQEVVSPDSTAYAATEGPNSRLCRDICSTEGPYLGSSKRHALGSLSLGRYPERWRDEALPTAFKKLQPPTSPLLMVVDDLGSHRGRG